MPTCGLQSCDLRTQFVHGLSSFCKTRSQPILAFRQGLQLLPIRRLIAHCLHGDAEKDVRFCSCADISDVD